jgi:hypothetical protein
MIMVEMPIEWTTPWRALDETRELNGIQRELEREITPEHPLHGKGAKAVGRRIDCDDIVVCLQDGTYANVHLHRDRPAG